MRFQSMRIQGARHVESAVPVFEVQCDTVDVYSMGAYERTDWRIIRNAICNDN